MNRNTRNTTGRWILAGALALAALSAYNRPVPLHYPNPSLPRP